MKTITQMQEEIDALMEKIGAVRSLAVNENRELTLEERTVCTSHFERIDTLKADIAHEIRFQKTKEGLEAPIKPAERTDISNQQTTIIKDEQEKKDRFASGGEFLMAVKRAGSPGGAVDQRLSTRAATGLGESIPSDGGFLVQQDFSAQLLENIWNEGMVTSRINRIPISGAANSLKINGIDETSRVDGSRAGGIRDYWAAEAAEKTASQPKFRQIELQLNKLIGLCYTTDELLEDASALQNIVTTGFRKEFDFKLTDGVINGSGAGQPLGILNAGCIVSVAKEAGQTAATVVYENIVKMWSRLLASSRSNAVWVVNQDVEPQLHQMSLGIGTAGVPVYMPAGGISGSPYSTIYGRPVVPIEQCATLGTTGDIMLCDFSQYVGIDKGGIQQDVSIHVRFVYDESCFRFVYRFDGQPILASAITPYKGTNTLSHFVKLDARA